MTSRNALNKVIDTDILIIGGGIAGCAAAIKAAEHKLNVTIVEKSKPERSGDASHGIDEIQVFPRDGYSPQDVVKVVDLRFGSDLGFPVNPNPNYMLYKNAFWNLEEFDRFGVTGTRLDDGDYYWFPFFDLEARLQLRVHWINIKPELAAAVRKRNINILERTVVIDLLTNNGRVVGATAVNTRTGEFIIIKAKATVVSTGRAPLRYYNCETPMPWKYKMRYHWCLHIWGSNADCIQRTSACMLVGNKNEPLKLDYITPLVKC